VFGGGGDFWLIISSKTTCLPKYCTRMPFSFKKCDLVYVPDVNGVNILCMSSLVDL
jgi:hypothetical protein